MLCTSGSIFTPPLSSAAGSVVFDAVCKLQKQAPLVAQSHPEPAAPKALPEAALASLPAQAAASIAQPWSQGCPTALLPSSLVSIVPPSPAPSAWESLAPFADKSPPWNSWDSCASAGLCSSPQVWHSLCDRCAEGKAGLAEASDAF